MNNELIDLEMDFLSQAHQDFMLGYIELQQRKEAAGLQAWLATHESIASK
jgi:hypothetical protein